MLATFSCSVTLSGGRTVLVQPDTQIVLPIVACVTAGLSAPGVHVGSRSVLGAGSIVTRDVQEGVFAAGNPCRIIREIIE